MKTPGRSIRFMAVVLGSAIAALSVMAYLAWISLRGLSEQGPMAISRPAIVTPLAPTGSVTASIAAAPAAPIATLPAASPVASPAMTQPVANWTAQENNYLFDLSHALQPVEYQRLSSAEQLEMARQIQQWMQSGEDFWSLYQRFDRSYGSSLVGDYDHNREVYIQLAAQHFAPDILEPLPYPNESPSGDWMPKEGFNPDSNPQPEAMPNWPSQPPRPQPQPPQNPPAIPNVIEASM